MRADGPLASVAAFVQPYNRYPDLYQSYYQQSIAAYCSREGIAFHEEGSRFPGQLRFLRRVRESARFQRIIPNPRGSQLIDWAARQLGAKKEPEQKVGVYVLCGSNYRIRVCVDASDSGAIDDTNELEQCDIYFKTNFWPKRSYPPKVLPLANLNPIVMTRRAQLDKLRNAEKEWDLFAFFRVWGGSDEVEGIEHNLTVFETLARVNCKKKLLAYLISGDIRGAAARLDKAGVPWTTKWMPLAEVWSLASRSKLNIVRHGMHQCIPWRMTEMLAMGSCPVLDYPATTRWHVPIEENVHYLNLGIPYRPSGAADFDPREVIDRVESWLSSQHLIRTINENTARYFDEHLTPERLGRYILQTSRCFGNSASC